MNAPALLLYCRPGFEKEAGAELLDHCAHAGIAGWLRAQPNAGVVRFHANEPLAADALLERLAFDELIFARQLLFPVAELSALTPDDRITPIVTAAQGLRVDSVWLETADTNEAKELSGFLKKFTPALTAALSKAGVIRKSTADRRLHLFFEGSSQVTLALSVAGNRSEWPQGIPRLRFPASAPSRSTLKLEEALLCLLTPEEREGLLRPGMKAVDLGASPGGWTWQLVRRDLLVTAIDNGPMDRALMQSGMVEHLRADGFTYRPRDAVDWLVCDMVESPIRVAELMAQWLLRGDARQAIFNLKLPMKKRREEVERCLQLVSSTLAGARMRHTLRCKQLYHDREEVTCFLQRL